MSLDVFVQCFQNGQSAGIPHQRLRDIFGAHLTETEPNLWQLRYDDANSCDLDLTADDSDLNMVRGFTVHRPCGDPRLWDAVASVLGLGEVVLNFPGCRAPLVALTTVTQHLPPNMVEALGQPIVVTTGKEIQDELRAT